jgi:uncharacterized protein (DUF1800 family)
MSSIQAYVPTTAKPWNKERLIHLYRRLGMGPSPQQVADGLQMDPSTLVDTLIDQVLSEPMPERPYWHEYTNDQFEDDEFYEARDEVRYGWMEDMVSDGMRSKLVLFWHNHFVTELRVYGCNKYLWSYYELLHQHCLGNFRTFVEEMGLNTAMLVYLDGNRNRVGAPNENYARELMELFTMGESNGYTQVDVAEMARALTGYRANQYRCETAYFSPNHFDRGQKTIFGETGNWNYNDVHELIFTRRADEVAGYTAEKIYRHFVYHIPDKGFVEELAIIFKESNWELAPLFKALFKSEHFFEEKWIGAMISSPLESLVKWSRTTQLTWGDIGERRWIFRWGPYDQGMEIFNHDSVAGWPGHRSWMNESNFAQRIKFLLMLNDQLRGDEVQARLVQWALSLTDEINNPEVITQHLSLEILGQKLEEDLLTNAIDAFKGEIPENYYEDGSWNLHWESAGMQIIHLLNYLARLPEAQLM